MTMWKNTDDSGILNAALNVLILVITLELLRMNQKNVRNTANMVKVLEEIKEKL